MGLFNKKPDPLKEQEHAIRARLEAIQRQIESLNERIEGEQHQPRLRSTALPQPHPKPPPPSAEVAFEEPAPHKSAPAPGARPDPQLEITSRQPPLLALWRRWWGHLRHGRSPNRQLVNYLAAGSIHGLRPLRYEKRIARNQFLVLCALFLAIIWGAIYLYLKNR